VTRFLGLAVLAATVATAAAEPRDAHVGVNLRTETGVHQARLDGGVRVGAWDVIVVVDPLVLTDGEHDLDVLVRWNPSEGHAGWALAGGWRTASIELASGHRFHQNLLVGATADLPCLVRGVRAQLGLELAIVTARHGAALGTDWLPTDDRVLDVIQPGMFLRLEHAWGF
jgi:hypothetical protein